VLQLYLVLLALWTLQRAQRQNLIAPCCLWLKNPQSDADKQQLICGLKTSEAIPTIRQIHIGVLASTEQRELVDNLWSVWELKFFGNEASQKNTRTIPFIRILIRMF